MMLRTISKTTASGCFSISVTCCSIESCGAKPLVRIKFSREFRLPIRFDCKLFMIDDCCRIVALIDPIAKNED